MEFKPLKDLTYLIGLIMYSLMAVFFCSTMQLWVMEVSMQVYSFFTIYGLFVIYTTIVMVRNKKAHGSFFRFSNISYSILLLLLANLSAFTLNRAIPVFQVSSDWLTGLFTLLNIGLVWFSIRKDYTYHVLNQILVILFTSGALLGLYGIFYTAVWLPYAFLGFWFLGLPLHLLVPLFWMILLTRIVIKFLKRDNGFQYAALIGLLFPIIIAIGFTIKWNNINSDLKKIIVANDVPLQEKVLPTWIALSKVLEEDFITEKILKSGVVYVNADQVLDGSWDSPRLDIKRRHDPFVVIASFFSPPLAIEETDRTKILNYMFDSRHQTERKLWTEKDLITKDIVTNVQLFPSYRLAYTEKTMTVENRDKIGWPRQQEALYTFKLPEGSVVTSASLWVDGIERASYLTTRNKADSAYTTIVGMERRDPLLLHWQEGNRVTVRVFPVTTDLPRKFKIGVTSPLQKVGSQLVYQNIDFDGPSGFLAEERINIVTTEVMPELTASWGFKEEENYWTYHGAYKRDWHVEFVAPALSDEPFIYDGKAYQISSEKRGKQRKKVTDVYLDINRSWSGSEFEKVWQAVKDQKVFVYQNRFIQLTAENRQRWFEKLQNRQFDLFPFHAIPQPKKSLVITQHHRFTPILSDLKDTQFAENMNAFFQQNTDKIAVYNIGEARAPYLQSLKELHVVDVFTGDLDEILAFEAEEIYPILSEDSQTVSLDLADLQIKTYFDTSGVKTTAPDHLMRLFIYNDLMKKIGRDYFKKDKLADELVAIAEKAHVVTPVSSLIVLETQADYDRFDLKKSKNSLDNASIQDAGAVPEPQEWLLILLVLSTGIFLWWRQSIGQ